MSKEGRKEREPLHRGNKTSYEYVSHSALHPIVVFWFLFFFLVGNNSKKWSWSNGNGLKGRQGGERYSGGLSLEYVLAAQQYEI